MKTRDLIHALSILDPDGRKDIEIWCPAMPNLKHGDAVLLKLKCAGDWKGIVALNVEELE